VFAWCEINDKNPSCLAPSHGETNTVKKQNGQIRQKVFFSVASASETQLLHCLITSWHLLPHQICITFQPMNPPSEPPNHSHFGWSSHTGSSAPFQGPGCQRFCKPDIQATCSCVMLFHFLATSPKAFRKVAKSIRRAPLSKPRRTGWNRNSLGWY